MGHVVGKRIDLLKGFVTRRRPVAAARQFFSTSICKGLFNVGSIVSLDLYSAFVSVIDGSRHTVLVFLQLCMRLANLVFQKPRCGKLKDEVNWA